MLRALLVLLVAAISACDAGAERAPSEGPARRVASLSPAITATIVELGWADRLVGRTPWCDEAKSVPVVGSLGEVDLERLAAVRPDLVLVQRAAAGPPAGLVEVARARGWRLQEVPCTSLDDVRRMPARVAEAMREPSDPSIDAAWSRALAPVAAARERSPVALLFSADPPQAFGQDTFLSQAWQAWGGSTLPAGGGHPQLALEDLFSAPPRRVVLVGAATGAESLARACGSRGVDFEIIPDARLLRPGPQLREALFAWRARLEGAAP